MENDSNTPAMAGTEVVEPSSGDNVIPDYVFWDPDEDTPEDEVAETTDDDGQSTDEEPETEEAETEDEGDEPEAEDEAETATLIELPDGSKVDRDEVVKGYLRQADYTRKNTEVAEQRKVLDAETTRIAKITDAFIDKLSAMVPPAPDASLAYSNPTKFNQQKALHEAALAQVQEIVSLSGQVKEAQGNLESADFQRVRAEENRRLAERFPQTTNPKGREAFFTEAAEAAEAAGFSLDELGSVTDHRLFTLAHYARIGMKAQESKAKATQKAAKAPPVSPQKPASTQKANAARRNGEAMRKLSKSGSIYDAMRVDFD